MQSLVIPLRADGRQSASAAAIQKGVCRHLRARGFATLCEFTLATGRRVDVIGLSQKGEIWIVEIKSSREDYLSDRKWPEYRDFCDRYFFAIGPSTARELLPCDAGLIVADAFDAEIVRDPDVTPLAAARRKALTLHFARAAALRLHGLYDPDHP